MRLVRYFGKLADPASYRKGFGWRGWLISVADRLRIRLEQYIVISILKIEARRAGLSKNEQKIVVRQAKTDPLFDGTVAHHSEVRRTFTIRDAIPEIFSTADQRRLARYGEGRKNADEAPIRPTPFEEGIKVTFARFQQRNDRSARYVGARRTQTVFEREEPNNE